MNLKALKKNELDFILQYYKKEDIEKLPAKYIAGFLWNLFAQDMKTIREAQFRYNEILRGD